MMPAARSRRSRTHSRADGAPLSSTRAGTGSAYGAQPRQHPVQEERSGRMLIPRPAVSPLTGARMPTLRRNTVVLGSGTDCRTDPWRAERGSRRRSMLRTGARLGSAERSALGRPSRGRRHWRSRLLHKNADLAQSRAPGYAWRRVPVSSRKACWIGWSASPSASPSRNSDLCRRGQPRTPGR